MRTNQILDSKLAPVSASRVPGHVLGVTLSGYGHTGVNDLRGRMANIGNLCASTRGLVTLGSA
ncbi:hypothetical protein DPMN_036257 [Dreissena polymorpha]|uniref:Uncharacterized protein n=1 Tax=Dreissena polymorpha TaxID=45954 RepID=A0A9D4RNN6_DREPO|nr:hypothetical protein DPMN_036257 [Dreissena polymorpha]